ncbi:sodium/proton-translocating pyrophosphatase, partial [Methylogaea oryzae]
MREISAAIQEGASAFLGREYRILAVFVAIVAVIMTIFLQWQSALCFVVGAVASAGAGYLG